MDAPQQHSVEEATRRFLLSRTMQTLLDRSFFVGSPTDPVIDVASFLRTVIDYKSSSTANVVVQKIFGAVGGKFPATTGGGTARKRATSRTLVTDGLWQAFEEAEKLRLATGGNDQFIGLRYVLFAILTARTGALATEIGTLFSDTGVNPGAAGEAIARYCMEGHEPSEDYMVWQAALTVRQLENALTSWSGQAPAGDAMDGSVTLSLESAIALLQPDDPWALLTHDHSGAVLEANAFADMIVAKQFRPPLAVGIFGDWGAGKSYFMRLLYDAVADNRRRLALSQETGGITFCERVVQIRFNAWHYTTENLWASLVDHIFTSLSQWDVATGATEADKLFDQLTSARQLMIEAAAKLVETRRVKQAAAIKLTEAEDRLRAKQAAVEVDPKTFVTGAFNMIVAQTGAKEKLDEAAETLGLTALSTNAKALEEASTALGSELDRYAMLRNGVARQLAVPVVIALVTAGTLVFPLLMSWLTDWFNVEGAQPGASIAGLVAPLVAALGWATARSNDALNVVKGYRAEFDAEVARLTAVDQALVADRAKEAADAEAEVAAAQASLDVAAKGANEAALLYSSETGGERMLRFVRERVADGDYAKHLGLIATVRKDFEELSRLLGQLDNPPVETVNARTAHEKLVTELVAKAGNLLEPEEKQRLEDTKTLPENNLKSFERIILYVDDLDRCQPDHVVQVLQAIHLLLTFPLFVVFVAVDVRWLRRALKELHKDQFIDEKDPQEATTSDYLEKVFQIPYWVRKFGPEVTKALLLERIGSPVAEGPVDQPADPEPAAVGTTAAPEAGTTPVPATTAAPVVSVAEVVKPVTMTPQERDFIEKISTALDGLPRRTLRFINTYWIIKGGLSPSARVELEKDGYPALLALLAIAITLDDEYPKFAGALDAVANKRKSVDTVLNDLSFARPEVAAQVRKCLDAVDKPSPANLRRYAALVARYSFHRGLPAAE